MAKDNDCVFLHNLTKLIVVGSGRSTWGIIYTFTAGVFGVGWILDGIRMSRLVEGEETTHLVEYSRESE